MRSPDAHQQNVELRHPFQERREIRQPGPRHHPLGHQRQRPAMHRARDPEPARAIAVHRQPPLEVHLGRAHGSPPGARYALLPPNCVPALPSPLADQSRLTPSRSTMAVATQIEE